MHNFSTLVCLTQTPVALVSASKQEENPAAPTLKPGRLPFATGELHLRFCLSSTVCECSKKNQSSWPACQMQL